MIKDWEKHKEEYNNTKNNDWLSLETYTFHSKKKRGFIETNYFFGVRGNEGIKYTSKMFKTRRKAFSHALAYMRKH